MIAELNRSALSVAVAASMKTFEAVTKQLKLQRIGTNSPKRKLVISTNWLDAFCFKKGTKTVEEVIGDKLGMRIRLAEPRDTDTKLVYERSYKNRGNETQTDTRHQGKIQRAFGDAEEVHITFSRGLLTIVPVFSNKERYVNDPVRLVLNEPVKSNELDTTIFAALDYIENAQARKVVIDYGDAFDNSEQKVLLDLQLRRLGYTTVSEQTDRKSMSATMMPDNDDPEDDIHPVSIHGLSYDATHHQSILSNINVDKLRTAFFAASSGVDISAMEHHGFIASALNEWRPHERRDISIKTCKDTGEEYEHVNDKSESGAVCAAINSQNLKYIFNEDIYKFDIARNTQYLDDLSGVGVYHVSFQCDEFSLCKSQMDKERSIVSLDTTLDMFMPSLKHIRQLKPAMIIVENVPGFVKSTSRQLFQAKLESMGYSCHMKVLNALDYNGYSSRKRMMFFATVLDADFAFPEAETKTTNLWNDVIKPNFHRLRDVSHTKGTETYLKGKAIRFSGKDMSELSRPEKTLLRKYQCANVVQQNDAHCGTLLKSQNRQVAESLVIEHEGKFLFPDNEILKLIMGIDESFDIGKPFTQEIGAEIIGQSIDVNMHRKFAESVETHIQNFLKKGKSVLNTARSLKRQLGAIKEHDFEHITPTRIEQNVQLSLF